MFGLIARDHNIRAVDLHGAVGVDTAAVFHSLVVLNGNILGNIQYALRYNGNTTAGGHRAPHGSSSRIIFNFGVSADAAFGVTRNVHTAANTAMIVFDLSVAGDVHRAVVGFVVMPHHNTSAVLLRCVIRDSSAGDGHVAAFGVNAAALTIILSVVSVIEGLVSGDQHLANVHLVRVESDIDTSTSVIAHVIRDRTAGQGSLHAIAEENAGAHRPAGRRRGGIAVDLAAGHLEIHLGIGHDTGCSSGTVVILDAAALDEQSAAVLIADAAAVAGRVILNDRAARHRHVTGVIDRAAQARPGEVGLVEVEVILQHSAVAHRQLAHVADQRANDRGKALGLIVRQFRFIVNHGSGVRQRPASVAVHADVLHGQAAVLGHIEQVRRRGGGVQDVALFVRRIFLVIGHIARIALGTLDGAAAGDGHVAADRHLCADGQRRAGVDRQIPGQGPGLAPGRVAVDHNVSRGLFRLGVLLDHRGIVLLLRLSLGNGFFHRLRLDGFGQILPHRLLIGKGHRCHGQQNRRRQETCQ